jgi:hypothetical protein
MLSRHGALLFAAMAAAACAPDRFRWEATEPPALAAYRSSFVVAAGTTFDRSWSRAELGQALQGARVLWLGDHHRSSRLHGMQSEVLASLQAAGAPLLLALEAVGEQDAAAVQAFLAGALELPELRRQLRLRWPGSWLDDDELDPWHYQQLLQFARRHTIPVVAFEPTPRLPLAVRDAYIAARLGELAARHPDRLLVVHIGQAHLLGDGDLIARTGLPSIALGGEPPDLLRRAAPPQRGRGRLHRSTGGLWWFDELLP